jgi:hypothetical protein
MAGSAETHKDVAIPQIEGLNDELCLSEVGHLNRFRRIDGSHDFEALSGVRDNLVTAVKEAAMPFAVSTTYQEYRNGTYWWLDQTPGLVAASGLRFHEHPAALQRVEVEIDEACDLVEGLRPGMVKVFISPKMSRADAPYEIAKREHLGDDDMLRIHMVDVAENGQTKGKFMQSMLVRDVPLEAWVRMLGDSHNIFNKAIDVEDKQSALSVMKVHRQLSVPIDRLPNGVLSLLEAVLPYADSTSQVKIRKQLELFHCDQTELHRQAENIADRWLAFEVDMADSLHDGYANEAIQYFIRGLAFQWSSAFAAELMQCTLRDGRIKMTRSLASQLETSKRNTLWVAGGVLTKNERVLSQLDFQTAQRILANELFIQTMMHEGQRAEDIRAIETQNEQAIAGQNVTAGGGCPGEQRGAFEQATEASKSGESADGNCPEIKNGQRVHCPGCKKQVQAIVPDKQKIYCSTQHANWRLRI